MSPKISLQLVSNLGASRRGCGAGEGGVELETGPLDTEGRDRLKKRQTTSRLVGGRFSRKGTYSRLALCGHETSSSPFLPAKSYKFL